MDWARDHAGLSNKDLDKVFRYEERPATVVRMLVGKKGPEIWSLNGEDEWDKWLNHASYHDDCPNVDQGISGLVLILAKRTGEVSFDGAKKAHSNDWLERLDAEMPERSNTLKAMEVSLNEKSEVSGPISGSTQTRQRRSARTLPFSQLTFRHITQRFYTHRSIARDISRADIPVFSGSEVLMGNPEERHHPANVYNCRSSNAWDMDLALTATYFPHSGLTFAILFGCPFSVEEEIIKRLSFATAEAAHPLLMPGIFAELERKRHVHIVEATIDEIETKIFELDFQNRERLPKDEAEKQNQDKRSAWLDTSYLRNGLVSWNTQLQKMIEQAEELSATVFRPMIFEKTAGQPKALLKMQLHAKEHETNDSGSLPSSIGLQPSGCPFGQHTTDEEHVLKDIEHESPEVQLDSKTFNTLPETEVFRERMRRVGHKIKDRIQAISHEYDEKIRDCTMRVDGMAMATQWSHGETNVEIALATRRESKHMRSIALVTMVFLPGTFFASVFSMTFFDWSSNEIVSSYIWIYIVVTVFFTALTVGSWWYLVVYRPSKPRKELDKDEIPLL